MSFLAPLFLFGVLAAAVPILFHLIRRSSRERVAFSSLMFLQASPPRITKRTRLENLWLLLLRCLILGLLAAGFARPFLYRALETSAEPGGGRKVAVLMDTSASMRRGDLWGQARAEAERVLDGMGPRDEMALLFFDRRTRPVVRFEQWNETPPGERKGMVSAILRESEPGWGRTELGLGLVGAIELLEESEAEDGVETRREVVLITDLQEGSRLDALQAFDWPSEVELQIKVVKAEGLSNAGLQVAAEREGFHIGTEVSGPRVRVINSSESKRDQFRIGWATPDGRNTEDLELYIPAGRRQVVELPAFPEETVEGQFILKGDDEDFDNTVFWVAPRKEENRVIYLGSEPDTDAGRMLFYLRRALQGTARHSLEIVAYPREAPIPGEELERATLIIITERVSEERAGAVRRFLSGGGSVLFVMNELGMAESLGRIAGTAVPAVTEFSGGGYALFGEIDFEHPLFTPFADPRYSDFTKIHIWRHRQLEWPEGRVLARFDNRNPALIQIAAGEGVLWALTTGWHPRDSQLALSSKFVPLLYSVLQQSGGLAAGRTQFEVGDAVSLPRTGDGPTVIRRPDGSEQSWALEGPYLDTDLPGIYTVLSAEPPVRFAVNIAPEESQTATLSPDELEQFGARLESGSRENLALAEVRTRQLRSSELEGQQKLWRWLILGALMAVLLETWLAGRITRRNARPA